MLINLGKIPGPDVVQGPPLKNFFIFNNFLFLRLSYRGYCLQWMVANFHVVVLKEPSCLRNKAFVRNVSFVSTELTNKLLYTGCGSLIEQGRVFPPFFILQVYH